MTKPAFKFALRQVVYTPKAKLPGTIIGRAEHLAGEPTYLVRPCSSTSRTEGRALKESQLRAF